MKHVRRRVPPGKKIRIAVRVRDSIPAWRNPRLKEIADGAVRVLGERVGLLVSEHWVVERTLWITLEASSSEALARGMQGLGVRIAKAVHRLRGTTGGVLADRYELLVPLPKRWSESGGGLVRGAAKLLWRGAGVVQNEWMDPEGVERGPPLAALGKALATFALAVVTARPGPSYLSGRPRNWRAEAAAHDRAMWKRLEEHRRRRTGGRNRRYDHNRLKYEFVDARWEAWMNERLAAGEPREEVLARLYEGRDEERARIKYGTWRWPRTPEGERAKRAWELDKQSRERQRRRRRKR